eukprot:Lankesteria_metandrocarpae@DN4769_c0_g1_i1.p5
MTAKNTTATFTIPDEDHTLGNVLRAILCNNADVEFAGYSVPHPTEMEINFRLQTVSKPCAEVMYDGLRELAAACDVVEKRYTKALDTKNAEDKNSQQSSAD